MKTKTTLFFLMAACLSTLFSSCAVIGGIFKTGVGVGVFITVLVVIIIIIIIAKIGGK